MRPNAKEKPGPAKWKPALRPTLRSRVTQKLPETLSDNSPCKPKGRPTAPSLYTRLELILAPATKCPLKKSIRPAA